jgi:hypothetical protein
VFVGMIRRCMRAIGFDSKEISIGISGQRLFCVIWKNPLVVHDNSDQQAA